MLHETAQITVGAGASAEHVAQALRQQLQQVPGLVQAHVGVNLPGCWGAADLTLDLCWQQAGAALPSAALLQDVQGVAHIERVAYQRVGGGSRSPGLQQGIWRTLLLRVRPGTGAATVAAFEQDLLRMPQYMAGIRNWQLARVSSPSDQGWTHVWQQEFAQLGDLHGEYLLHPYHWAWVDRWFDAEHPQGMVDAIAHVFCPLAHSWLSPAAAAQPQEFA